MSSHAVSREAKSPVHKYAEYEPVLHPQSASEYSEEKASGKYVTDRALCETE